MDRGAWLVYSPRGCKRERKDLVTKQQQCLARTFPTVAAKSGSSN